jgi:hypothetical protein
VQPDERLLHHILSARPIAYEQQRQPEQSRTVGPEQGADELVSFGPPMIRGNKAS